MLNRNNKISDLVSNNVHVFIFNDPDPLLPIDKHHLTLTIIN